MDDTLTLLSYTRTQDSLGRWIDGTPTKTEVFCKCSSISRSEFFQGGRTGLNPEFQFTVAAVDDAGQRECVYHDQTYAIYRTYRTDDDYMELYVQRKGGTNGKGNSNGET